MREQVSQEQALPGMASREEVWQGQAWRRARRPPGRALPAAAWPDVPPADN